MRTHRIVCIAQERGTGRRCSKPCTCGIEFGERACQSPAPVQPARSRRHTNTRMHTLTRRWRARPRALYLCTHAAGYLVVSGTCRAAARSSGCGTLTHGECISHRNYAINEHAPGPRSLRGRCGATGDRFFSGDTAAARRPCRDGGGHARRCQALGSSVDRERHSTRQLLAPTAAAAHSSTHNATHTRYAAHTHAVTVHAATYMLGRASLAAHCDVWVTRG